MKKKSKSIRVLQARQAQEQEAEYTNAPHSFVFHRGIVGANVKALVRDMKKVMAPFTASNLKVGKRNSLKDFVSVAGPLHISHFLIFSKTETSVNFKVARLPRGPTLTFRVCEYTLSRDVISSLKRHYSEQKQFEHHPLLVMNNFSGEEMQLKLIATMFQNMFPAINVNKVKLNKIRRCVLMNYNKATRTVDFRHYNIRVVPVGMTRGVKKLIKAKLPDMSNYEDISDYVMRGGNLSESEAELDGPDTEVTLPQHISSRGNQKSAKSAIRLTELGPRLKLQLVKIEEEVCGGEVMFHEYVRKTKEEIQAAKLLKKKKKILKEQRKQKQEENINLKAKKKAEHKERSLAGMKKKMSMEKSDEVSATEITEEMDHQTDAAYYQQEVGVVPDSDLFPSAGTKRKVGQETHGRPKKKRIEKSQEKGGKRKFDSETKQKLEKQKKEYYKNLNKKRLQKKRAKAKKMKHRPKRNK